MPIHNVVPEITPSVRGKHRIVMMSPAHHNTTTTNNNNNNNNRNSTIAILTNSNTSNCRTNNKYNSKSSSNNNNDINNNIINNDDNDNTSNNNNNNNNNKFCSTNKNIDIETTNVKNSIDSMNKNHSTDNNSRINNINKYNNDITNQNADYSPDHDIIWYECFSKTCIQTSESPVNEHNKSKMNLPLEGMIQNFECCMSCTNCDTLEGTFAYFKDSNNNQQQHQQRQQLQEEEQQQQQQQPQQQQRLHQHNLTRIECLKRLQSPRNTIILNNNNNDDDDDELFEHLDQSNDCDALELDKDSSSFLQQHKEKIIYQNYCEKLGGEQTLRRCRGSKAMINGLYFKWILTVVVAVSSLLPTAAASCTRGVTELWAYSSPGSEEFSDSYTRYITSSKGAICRWRVISSKKDWIVQLKFDPFQLKHTTGDKKGDCLEIYNGDNKNAPLLDELCDKEPKVYKSKGRHLYVVYRRGKVPGERRIGFEYQALDTDSNENLIRIAGIIGGCLAGIGLIYLIIRYTQCCGCFGKKEGDGTNSGHANRPYTSNSQERDRLTIQVLDDGEGGIGGISSSGATRITTPGNRPPLTSTTTTTTANGSSNLNSNGHDSTTATAAATTATNNSHGTGLNRSGHPSSNNNVDFNTSNDNTVAGAVGGSGSIGGDVEDLGEESDSGSLHTLNEPPPSYESLYLNEDGETEPPPEYTPPRHKAKNPPRRVHTFN